MGRSLNRLPQFPCTLLLSDSISVHRPSFQSGAVWQTFDAIKEVNRPEEIDWRTIPSMQTIAWKTGTSYGFRDAWAVGVTPKYAVGVWVGNATGEGNPGWLVPVRQALSCSMYLTCSLLLPGSNVLRANWLKQKFVGSPAI